MSGIMCDKIITIELKGKVHKTVVRSVMLNVSGIWALRNTEQMLRWMFSSSKLERI